jgi:hypothetical protein
VLPGSGGQTGPLGTEEEGISKRELEKTVDQRILGDDEFVGKVLDKGQEKILPGKRQHEFKLEEIAGGIQEVCGIGGEELRGKGRSPETMRARCLFSLIAREYGYKGVDIGKFLRRESGSITKYSNRREELEETLKRVLSVLDGRDRFKIQV